MRLPKQLNSVFPNWLTGGGIFNAFKNANIETPWAEKSIEDSLDIAYHGEHSGSKWVSPLIRRLLDDDGELSAENLVKIVNAIFVIYGENWAKEWATLSFEYNPINNYDMQEQMTDDITETEYGRTNTRTGSEVDTPDLETDNNVYGYNSDNAVPAGQQKQTGTNTHEYDDVTDTQGGKDTNTRNYTLERSGNIGVTTSQQMIQSERDLWIWNYFNDVVFHDLDRMLTLRVY